MNYAKIKNRDIADGPGVRVTLFVSGCSHRCDGCFNPETWSYGYGQGFTKKTEDQIIKELKSPFIQGLTLLGGEPFDPSNVDTCYNLCLRVKREAPGKDIWAYSGYTYDEIKFHPIMKYIDVLVDGPFIKDLHTIDLQFRGSSNQRIIDVQSTLRNKNEEIILWSDQFKSDSDKMKGETKDVKNCNDKSAYERSHRRCDS